MIKCCYIVIVSPKGVAISFLGIASLPRNIGTPRNDTPYIAFILIMQLC